MRSDPCYAPQHNKLGVILPTDVTILDIIAKQQTTRSMQCSSTNADVGTYVRTLNQSRTRRPPKV